MKRILGVLTVVLALGLASTASAVTIQTTDTTYPWQAWANASQAPTFAGDVPMTVAGADAACGDDAGCTAAFPRVDQTTGAILPGAPESVSVQIAMGDSVDMERGYLLHELGHVFDAEYMTDSDREQFMSMLGLRGGSARWWYALTTVSYGVTIHFAPGEWFAESYRMCATWGVDQSSEKVNTFEDYGYPGDRPAFAIQQRQACRLIDRVGADNGVRTPPQSTPRLIHVADRVQRRIHLTWGRRRVW